MTRLLRRLLNRDDPPTLIAQYRALWRVPADWTLPTSAKVVPTRKPRTIADWTKKYAERKRA